MTESHVKKTALLDEIGGHTCVELVSLEPVITPVSPPRHGDAGCLDTQYVLPETESATLK